MGLGPGIAGIVLAVVSIFATFPINLLLLFLTLVCCSFAVRTERGGSLAVAAWIVSAASLLLTSPLTVVYLSGPERAPLYLTLAMFALPLLVAMLRQPKRDDDLHQAFSEPQSQPFKNEAPERSKPSASTDNLDPSLPPPPVYSVRQAAIGFALVLVVTAASYWGYQHIRKRSTAEQAESRISSTQNSAPWTSAQPTTTEQANATPEGLPSTLNNYFRHLVDGNYVAAFKLTQGYQRSLAQTTDYIRMTYPQAMWPQKNAEAEQEALDALWTRKRRDGPKVVDHSKLPMIELFRPGATWKALEQRPGGNIFVELSYSDSGPDTNTPLVSVTSIRRQVPFGIYNHAPLKRVILDVMHGGSAAVILWSVVPDSDQWFEWPEPAIVGVELIDGGMRHFGRDPVIVEPNDPYLRSYDLSVYVYGGNAPYKSINFKCRSTAQGTQSFSQDFQVTDERPFQKLSVAGPFDFTKAVFPQSCLVTVLDSRGQPASVTFEMSQAPSPTQGYSKVEALCWNRKSLDITNAYLTKCGSETNALRIGSNDAGVGD